MNKWIPFRGEEVEVTVRVNDEPDVNAFFVEWDFVAAPQPPATEQECRAIDDLLHQRAIDSRYDTDDEELP